MNWLVKEQTTSRLERFRQLQNEILLLERNREYYDEETPSTTNGLDKNIKLSEKLKKIIEQIEREEAREEL